MTTLMSRSRKLTRAGRPAKAAMRGMTLLEIMVVITIIGVVMGTVAVAVIPQLNKAKVDQTKNSIRGGIVPALKMYYTRHGRYPDTSQGLNVLVGEKILDGLPRDGWGNEFVYTSEGASKYTILSYGADAAPGGEDTDADINSNTMDQVAGK